MSTNNPDIANPAASEAANRTKVPKKRFIGRRAADAQAQKDADQQQHSQSDSLQRGKIYLYK